MSIRLQSRNRVLLILSLEFQLIDENEFQKPRREILNFINIQDTLLFAVKY